MDYTTLVGDKTLDGSIKNWVNRGDIPVTTIVVEAEAWIHERLRAREMLSSTTLQVTAGLSTVALPDDFLDPEQWVPYGAVVELPYVDPVAIAKSTNSAGVVQSGTPSRWTIIGTSAHVDVAASNNFGGFLTYFAKPGALVDAVGGTNFLTTRYPTLVRLTCMAFAFQHMKDAERSTQYFELALKFVLEANATNDLAKRNRRPARVVGSAMSYSTLTADKEVAGSIRNLVDRADVAAELIIVEAEAWIYERLRVREMQSRNTTFAFLIDTQSTNLPSDFLDPISFTPYGDTCPLLYVHEEGLLEQREEDGTLTSATPNQWTIIGDVAYVDVSAIETMTGVLLYYARPASLSGSNLTNFLTVKHPSLLRYACMMKAFEQMRDMKRSSDYMTLAMAALNDVKVADDLKRRGQYVPA